MAKQRKVLTNLDIIDGALQQNSKEIISQDGVFDTVSVSLKDSLGDSIATIRVNDSEDGIETVIGGYFSSIESVNSIGDSFDSFTTLKISGDTGTTLTTKSIASNSIDAITGRLSQPIVDVYSDYIGTYGIDTYGGIINNGFDYVDGLDSFGLNTIGTIGDGFSSTFKSVDSSNLDSISSKLSIEGIGDSIFKNTDVFDTIGGIFDGLDIEKSIVSFNSEDNFDTIGGLSIASLDSFSAFDSIQSIEGRILKISGGTGNTITKTTTMGLDGVSTVISKSVDGVDSLGSYSVESTSFNMIIGDGTGESDIIYGRGVNQRALKSQPKETPCSDTIETSGGGGIIGGLNGLSIPCGGGIIDSITNSDGRVPYRLLTSSHSVVLGTGTTSGDTFIQKYSDIFTNSVNKSGLIGRVSDGFGNYAPRVDVSESYDVILTSGSTSGSTSGNTVVGISSSVEKTSIQDGVLEVYGDSLEINKVGTNVSMSNLNDLSISASNDTFMVNTSNNNRIDLNDSDYLSLTTDNGGKAESFLSMNSNGRVELEGPLYVNVNSLGSGGSVNLYADTEILSQVQSNGTRTWLWDDGFDRYFEVRIGDDNDAYKFRIDSDSNKSVNLMKYTDDDGNEEDKSTGFTEHTLVDKKYVDDAISAGGSSELTVTINLSSSDIINLHTTPIVAIPSVDSKSILFKGMITKFTFNTTPYDSTFSNIGLYLGDREVNTISDMFGSVNVNTFIFPFDGFLKTSTALKLENRNDAFRGGDSTIEITIRYELIDL